MKPSASAKPLPSATPEQVAQLQVMRDQLDVVRAAHPIPAGSGVGYNKRHARTPAQIALDDAYTAAFSARHDAMDAEQQKIKAFLATWTTVGRMTIVNRYDRWAPHVLVQKNVIEEVYVERAEDAKRRPQAQYVALLPWPTVDAYKAMRDAHYTGTAEDLVEEARSVFEDLQDQMQSWYDGMPENFQSGEKGEAVNAAADALSEVVNDTIDVPEIVKNLPVIVLPSDGDSRADQCGNACGVLDAVRDAAEAEIEKINTSATYLPTWCLDEGDTELPFSAEATAEQRAAAFIIFRDTLRDALTDLRDRCDEVKSNAEGIEFPGMY